MSEEFTIDQLIGCVKREVAYRRKVYPRLVTGGGMSQWEMERQIGMMAKVAEKLEAERQPKLF
jgi:hypothetical protein